MGSEVSLVHLRINIWIGIPLGPQCLHFCTHLRADVAQAEAVALSERAVGRFLPDQEGTDAWLGRRLFRWPLRPWVQRGGCRVWGKEVSK